MAYSQVAIIMLKKFSKARGEAVFMEEVTQEQRLESAKRRRQGRGQHPQGNPPTGWGHIRDGGGGAPRHPGLCWAERLADQPGLSGPGENKQTHHGARWHPFG